MITTDIGKWADYLATAALRNEAVSPITDVEPTLTVQDAYAIQDAIIERRLASGERLVGAKVGLTSRAKQQEMGINEPVYGWLTDAMALEADSSLRLSTLIHPGWNPRSYSSWVRHWPGPGSAFMTYWTLPRRSAAALRSSTAGSSTSASCSQT